MSLRPDVVASSKIKARGRTYFLDLESHRGFGLCLVINESKRILGGKFERHRVIVDSDYIVEFFASLGQLLNERGLLRSNEISRTAASPKSGLNANQLPLKREPFEEVRRDYPNAYKMWTPEDDANLKDAFRFCKDLAALAYKFQRKPGAIQSRLRKLALTH